MEDKPSLESESAILLRRPPFIIHHFTSLGSTNDHLKQMTDAPEFTCVTADEQTAGRGRRDRQWHSVPGDGLYLSVLLRPSLPAAQISLLSLLCAIAVAETIGRYNVGGLDIKWPNDVLLNEKKVSGILIEGTNSGSETPRIIAGIGVNLNHASFPDELQDTATSLFIESQRRIEVAEFRDQLLIALARWYETLRYGNGSAIRERWMSWSSYARNRSVVITLDDETIAGVTEGLTDTGALLLRISANELRTIFTGEVRRLRSDHP